MAAPEPEPAVEEAPVEPDGARRSARPRRRPGPAPRRCAQRGTGGPRRRHRARGVSGQIPSPAGSLQPGSVTSCCAACAGANCAPAAARSTRPCWRRRLRNTARVSSGSGWKPTGRNCWRPPKLLWGWNAAAAGWTCSATWAAPATELGSYYDAIRNAVISGLRGLLADYPELPELTMMDDTPDRQCRDACLAQGERAGRAPAPTADYGAAAYQDDTARSRAHRASGYLRPGDAGRPLGTAPRKASNC